MAFAQFGKGFAPRAQRPATVAPTARSVATRLLITALLRALAQKCPGHRPPDSKTENDECAQQTRFPGPCRGYAPPLPRLVRPGCRAARDSASRRRRERTANGVLPPPWLAGPAGGIFFLAGPLATIQTLPKWPQNRALEGAGIWAKRGGAFFFGSLVEHFLGCVYNIVFLREAVTPMAWGRPRETRI